MFITGALKTGETLSLARLSFESYKTHRFWTCLFFVLDVPFSFAVFVVVN